MEKETVRKGVSVIKQGEKAKYFYVIQKGAVDVLEDGKRVHSFGAGDSFGELALVYDSPSDASCVTRAPSVLWRVDQSTFRHMLARQATSAEKNVNEILSSIPLFQDMPQPSLQKFIGALTAVYFTQGERILTKGDVGEIFYIVEDGMVRVHDKGLGDSQVCDSILKQGDYFGEQSLLTGEPQLANVTAMTDCTCLCISRDTFEMTLGPLQQIMDRTMRKRFLTSLPIFISSSKFDDHEMDRLTDLVIEQCYKKGYKLCEAGKPYRQELWIIRSGRVVVTNKHGKIFTLKTGDYFGDKTMKGDPNHISSHTAVMEENTTCWVLSRKDIESVVGDIQRLGESLPFTPTRVNKSILLKDLNIHRVLGQGAFGKVYLVCTKEPEKQPYALKKLDKRLIISSRQEYGVRRERDIMYSIEHPFLLQLVSSFQDEDSLYMLLDLIQGGELFDLIHRGEKHGIPVEAARFYGASIVEALGHLHNRCIVYRDLKPENVCVNADGYITIVDFGFAKVVVDKTFTLCGTAEYLAPEIIMSKGHDKAVDYWAFGVLLFEMLVGRTTFVKSDMDQITLFKTIVEAKFDIPEKVDPDAQDVIRRLLIRPPSHRLGHLAGGHKDVQNHSFFKPILVKKLLRKEYDPPHKPAVKDPMDSSNFKQFEDEKRGGFFRKRLDPRHQAVFESF